MMQGPYNSPESYGLTLVGVVSWDDEPYQFYMTAVWKDDTGTWYTADDSGCSCPMPFEDVTRADLVPTTRPKVIEHLISTMGENPAGQGEATALMERIMSM